VAYELKLHRDVEKQLRRIPKNQQERLVDTMRSCCAEPRPNGCEHLQDFLYRVKVGEYKIVYAGFDAEVIVVGCKVGRRSEYTYRNLEKLLDKALNALIK
jgi:mRNA-degrading endonuclease RelE of RelBE toxin-antitoxin system